MALSRLARRQALRRSVALLLFAGCGGGSGESAPLLQEKPAVDGAPAAHTPTPDVTASLSLGRAPVEPGGTVAISAVLHAPGLAVGGVQADIELPPGVTIAAMGGKPDCAVNPDIHQEATLFGFLPPGCRPLSQCAGVRAVVLSLESITPIPDGAIVFTCQIHIDPYTGGTLALPLHNVLMSDPNGNRIEAAGIAGTIDVVGVPLPRPTATQTVPGSAPRVEMQQVNAAPGGSVDIDVTVRVGSQVLSALQVSFGMLPDVRVAARRNTQPLCTLDPGIDASASFAFQPPGCVGNDSCDSVAGVVYARAPETLPPDGLRFTCTWQINRAASGSYLLAFSQAVFTTSDGDRIAGEAVDGRVAVSGPLATPTPTPDPTPEEASVLLSQTHASPGARILVHAHLAAPGTEIAGVQVDFTFPPQVRVLARDKGRPNCLINPDFGRGGSSFAYRPSGCAADACTGVRALILSVDSVDPIPDGSELFTCVAQVAEEAAGTYALVMDGLILSDPTGRPVAGTGVDGSIVVDSM